MDKIAGFLEVGYNEQGEVVINHPDLKPDDNGVGHIVFSPNQARNLSALLNKHASIAEQEIRRRQEQASFEQAAKIPVDRSKRCMLSGKPETEDHREIDPSTGMQKDYVTLCPAERAKGFVRPVRTAYVHVGIDPEMRGSVLIKPGKHGCGTRTTVALPLAETYARDPGFYTGTFCCSCHEHRPLEEFVWDGTSEQVGS